MRKQTKIAALVSAAALLAIGASMTASAAWDHDPDTGEYIYLNSDGERAYGEWKKDGASWYYLNEETGLMDRNRLIPYEDYYYFVDGNGARVLGEWRYVDNTEGEEDSNGVVPGGFWYYFNASTGRACGTAGTNPATIGDYKFRFADDGRMITGWYRDDGGNLYYYNDSVVESDSTYGAGFTGWREMPAYEQTGDEEQDQDVYWYYLDGGKVTVGNKYIDKKWYYFDEDGIMQTGWQQVGTPSVPEANVNDYVYLSSDGDKLTGWQYVNGKKFDGIDEDGWFYLNSRGVPFKPANTEDATSVSDEEVAPVGYARIKGKDYLFSKDGRMLSGIYKIGDKDIKSSMGSSKVLAAEGIYYFSDDDWATGGDDGSMVTNSKRTVYDDYDNATSYYFSKDGKAYVYTIVSNTYYDGDGHKVVAEDDTYKDVPLGHDVAVSDKLIKEGSHILVSSSGTVVKKRTVSNVEGYKKYYVGKMPSTKEIDSGAVNWVAGNTQAEAQDVVDNGTGYEVIAWVD